MKASQLNEWVERGLLNVKLLDRTLAYFQNQSSFLQYIKTFKRPVPRIESPGFPGTQWNEFYWKDQTVMLLMQEPDFPDGKNPEFCAQLFVEEPGKWKLKMEQFRRWLDRGKNDPLPEYYGTGKNCTECGVFLWDTKSYVKHMRRNHGFKVKDGKLVGISQDVLKRDRIEEQRELERRSMGDGVSRNRPVEASPEQDPFDALIQSSSRGPSTSALKSEEHMDKYLLSDDSELDEDTEDSTNDVKDIRRGKSVKESKSQPVSKHTKTHVINMPADTKASKKTYDIDGTQSSVNIVLQKPEQDVSREDSSSSANKIETSSSLEPPAKRASSARNRQPDEDTIVSCPECGHQCPHSKIINHLKKCTRKMAPSKKKAPKSKAKEAETEELEKILDDNPPEQVPEVTEPSKPEPKKPKESKTAAIVKQIFMRKFAMQQDDSGLSEEDDIPRVAAEKVISPPPIKIKLQRKELSRESFEVSGDGSLNISKTDDSFDRLEPLVKEKPEKEVYDFDSNLAVEEKRPKYRKANAKPSYQEDWDSSDFSLSSFRDATDKEDKLREEKIREEKAKEAKLKAEIEKLKAVKLQEIMRKEDLLKERLKADKLKEIMLKEEKMREDKEKERLCLEKEKADEANRQEEQKRIKDQERREEEKRRREEVKKRREEERKLREEEAKAEAEKRKEEERMREQEEEKRKQEERRKAEEERKKSEEKRRKAEEREERLKMEEKKKQEEEKKRQAAEEEEKQRIEEEKQRIEEEKRKEEEKKREEERQAEEEKSREEDDKSEDEFSLLALTKPHKRFQYSDYRSGKYQEKEQKKEEEKKRKEDEERKKAEVESKRQDEQDKKKAEDSFAKLEHLIHPSPSLITEPRAPMLTKAAKKDIPSMIADDFAQEIFQACILTNKINQNFMIFSLGCKTIFETREDDSMPTMWSGICSG